MALALDPSFARAESRPTVRAGALAIPALASLGAGAIHAAAIGAHGDHRQAVVLFSVVAALQLGWGAFALSSSRRWLGLVGALGSAALVGGWVLAKVSGLSFIDGLEAKEPVQWADGMAAGLAALVVITTAVVALRHWRVPAAEALVRVFALPVAVLSLTGMIAAGGHNHAGHVHTDAAGNVVAAAVVPPHPFVPGQPIDLGGVPGVTPAEQARAENLLAAT
ncbi:MAG: hypothetical protein QOI47_1493, partial [Actinomycetota bacterium]|nr:hypothetical protein [Actinomycetota bacterium]